MQSNIANSKKNKEQFVQYIYQILQNELTQQMELLQCNANEMQGLAAEQSQYNMNYTLNITRH